MTAAQACKDAGTFLLLGGIGFDQIPAVRVWAEQNHELYLHHIATTEGSAGLRYSFTPQPSVEQVGTAFGQLALSKFRGQKVGVLWRDSPNWQPGRDQFESMLRSAGMTVVDYPVQINQGSYTQDLVQMKTAGVQVVFAWENALATTEMIQQAQGQRYFPSWLVFPFNLELKTLGNAGSLEQPLYGISSWEPYTQGWTSGPDSSYAADITEFQNDYKAYDPGANLNGDGGDLLFLNWEAEKGMRDLFVACGANCTRNRMAGILLTGYHKTTSPSCAVDFRGGDHHHGGSLVTAQQVVKDPNGNAAWVPTQRCIDRIG